MPDIKIKPQMDQPRVRVVNNTPKDVSSILEKEYGAQQKNQQPDQKENGPVQYSTDREETTGRRSTIAAADGVRRMEKGKTRSGDLKIRSSGHYLQTPQTPPEHTVRRV